ncbi:MAG: family 78 glycoside hydrolase catalytic domain, partial [Planctomycetota bacterium]
MLADDLRCEYHPAPTAVDTQTPRFSWICQDDAASQQAAWQIQVHEEQGGTCCWDSGRVAGDDCFGIDYAGGRLRPCTAYRWRLRLWDAQQAAGAWAEARFATGLLGAPLPGAWIGSPAPRSPAVPCLRRVFDCPSDLVEARLYGCARGLFRAFINGRRVGDAEFESGWSSYHRRLRYVCHEVTPLLQAGTRNCLGMLLAEGWYKGLLGWEGQSHHYGEATALRCALRLLGADGSVTWIAGDRHWQCHESHIQRSSLYLGEVQDAGAEPAAWSTTACDASTWEAARHQAPTDAEPVPAAHPGAPVRCIGTRAVAEHWQVRPGVWILDVGRNINGRLRLEVGGLPAGTTLRLRHGEMVLPCTDGPDRLYTANLRSAESSDVYVCAGRAEEVWEPVFTVHGFRYAELAGWPGEPPLERISCRVLGSDTPAAGTFHCSHELVNRLYENCVSTQRANYLEVPTDCPQRDERMGWTGDAQAFIRSATGNCDIAAFMTKWLDDLADDQRPDGRYPNVAPNLPRIGSAWGFDRGDAAWGDAGIICPWTCYQVYGDRRLLERHYPAMQRWLAFQAADARRHGDGILRHYVDSAHTVFGDWLAVDAHTSKTIIMNAFHAHVTGLTARIAGVLGHHADAEQYRQRHAELAAAFRAAFIRPDGRVLDTEGRGDDSQDQVSQTAQLLPLHFDLVADEAQRHAVCRQLVADIAARGHHLSTGFVGLPYLLPVL